MSILIRRNRAPTSRLHDILVLDAVGPVVIGASDNAWDPPELRDFSVLAISAPAGVVIGGIEDGFAGRLLILGNVGANPIDFGNEIAGALPRNRLILGAATFTLAPDNLMLQLIYLAGRWRRI